MNYVKSQPNRNILCSLSILLFVRNLITLSQQNCTFSNIVNLQQFHKHFKVITSDKVSRMWQNMLFTLFWLVFHLSHAHTNTHTLSYIWQQVFSHNSSTQLWRAKHLNSSWCFFYSLHPLNSQRQGLNEVTHCGTLLLRRQVFGVCVAWRTPHISMPRFCGIHTHNWQECC